MRALRFVNEIKSPLHLWRGVVRWIVMQVPLLDLKEQNLALEGELKAAFGRVFGSGHFILGKEVEDFEGKVARYLGVKYAIGVSSGTDALLLALMALGIGAGDEVLCPTFTFFATAGCIARTGAKPVFVDSNLDDFNIDVRDVAKKITKKTKAMMPVHLYGQAAEMDELMKLSMEKKIFVIEDAAQAIGAEYKNKKVGGIGTFGAFSFFPSKNLGGFGDAGLLTTNDDALAERAKVLRVHGSAPKYYHSFIGGNFRIDPLQAAMLSVKLDHLGEYEEKRRANAEFYSKNLVLVDEIILPKEFKGKHHIWNQYTLRVKGGKRDALKKFLQENHVGCEVYYPVPLHRQKCFEDVKAGFKTLKISEQLAEEVLSIPIFPELGSERRERVVEAIKRFFV